MAMAHNPGFLKLVDDAKSRIEQTDIEGYKAMVAQGDSHVLIDIREDSEWEAGHAKGAVHIGKGVIETALVRSHGKEGVGMNEARHRTGGGL